MNDNEKYQKEAMRKYIQKLENQETKIVSTPQTELDKELKIKVAGTKKQRNKERNKALIAANGRTKRERMREREKRNQVNSLDSKKKKPHWTCSQCGMNPAWLDYSVCYIFAAKKPRCLRRG